MVRIPNTLARLEGWSVVVRAVKRLSVTYPQRFSKEFNATGVRRNTQRRKNCVYNEGDVVEKSFQLCQVYTRYIFKFHCEVSEKRKHFSYRPSH